MQASVSAKAMSNAQSDVPQVGSDHLDDTMLSRCARQVELAIRVAQFTQGGCSLPTV